MRRILCPSPFSGGLGGVPRRRLPALRMLTLQEITGGRIWEHPGVVLRPQDRIPRRRADAINT